MIPEDQFDEDFEPEEKKIVPDEKAADSPAKPETFSFYDLMIFISITALLWVLGQIATPVFPDEWIFSTGAALYYIKREAIKAFFKKLFRRRN